MVTVTQLGAAPLVAIALHTHDQHVEFGRDADAAIRDEALQNVCLFCVPILRIMTAVGLGGHLGAPGWRSWSHQMEGVAWKF